MVKKFNVSRTYKLLLIILAYSYSSSAQFNESIRTGRPGQAIGPYAVGKNVFQTQTGFDIGGFNEDKNNFSGFNLAPNTVLRFGITRQFELNTAFEYRNDNFRFKDSTYSYNGLSLSTVGTRVNLIEGNNHIPSIGLQLSFKLPILAVNYNPDYIAPKILLIVNEKINEKVNLLINFGINYNGNNAQPSGVYVANLSYSISPKWSTFVENYGSFNNNYFENRWDTGLAYLFNDNLQFDIYGGMGNNFNRVDYFTSIGISWRTLTLRNRELKNN